MSDERSRRGKGRREAASASWVAAFACFALLVALLAPLNALAITEICGDGVDNDASGGDALCPAPDQDRDGYYSDGTGPNSGTDCDDTNREIYPGNGGRYVATGCAANEYKTCQSNGSYSACAALSAFTCHSGSGSTYWFSTSGSNSNSGTYASPWADYRCVSNSALGCYHAPVAGDCFVFRAGSYNASWSDAGTTRQLYINNRDGTSTDKITFMEAPGESADFVGVGTSPTMVQIAKFVTSDWIQWFGIDSHGGYAVNGLWSEGGTDWEVANAKFYDIEGNCGTNNCGGIKISNNGHRPFIHHNTFHDVYDRADVTNENNHNVVIMDVDAPVFNDNVCYNTSTSNGSGCYDIKHGFSGGSATTKRNVFANTRRGGIINEQPNHTIQNNYFQDVNGGNSGAAVEYRYLGSMVYYGGMILEYNTVVNSSLIEIFRDSPYTVVAGQILRARYNVVQDNRGTAYNADGTDGFIRIGYYYPDTVYDATIGEGDLVFDYNCYYNTAGTALFATAFGDSSSVGVNNGRGSDYANFAAWQAAGFDTHTINANPNLDAYGRIASGSCDTGWGWNNNITSSTPTGGGSACLRMRTR